jgi:hypothetical protein
VLVSVVGWGCTVGTTDGPLPTPTPLPARLMAVTITPQGGGVITVGASAPISTSGTAPGFGAFAQYSDGTSRYVDAAWTSSDDSIIAIDGGRLIARGRGEATLTARFEDQTDTETFRAEGGLAGRWVGSYVVEQCDGSSGSMQEVLCAPARNSRPAGFAAVGTTLSLMLEISENGADDLTAIASFGALRGTLTGKNRGGGFFYLQGQFAMDGTVINIVHWDSRVVRDGMEGFIGYQLRMPNLPGIGGVGAKLTGMTRQ